MDSKNISSIPEFSKKTYMTPQFKIYGNLSQITLSLAMTITSMSDGGMGNDKTS
jgi:hypothetical protein